MRTAIRHLGAVDPEMQVLIRRIGRCGYQQERREPDEALVRAIAHQQLHGAAARTILGRLVALHPDMAFPSPGRVLSTEFVNNGKKYQATWFQEPGLNAAGQAHKGAYFTFDGQSLRKAYLASPLEFSRVSSGFKMRFHPILQTWRAHLGVDYAAPTGTAVRSVGDGTVEFAGVQNGFGNVVFIKHRNNDTTVYAHLSRIGVARGQAVSQGQNIGAVGATGWATGPHLHFEFRINGMHVDPMTLANRADTVPVSPAARAAFAQSAAAMKLNLAAAASVVLASAQ